MILFGLGQLASLVLRLRLIIFILLIVIVLLLLRRYVMESFNLSADLAHHYARGLPPETKYYSQLNGGLTITSPSMTSTDPWISKSLRLEPTSSDVCLSQLRTCQGKILHTINHKREIPWENATENPLDNSSENPLEKWQCFGTYRWKWNFVWKWQRTSIGKYHWKSTTISEVLISGVQ